MMEKSAERHLLSTPIMPWDMYSLQFYNLLHICMDSYLFTVVDKKLILCPYTLFHVQNQGLLHKYTAIPKKKE